MAEFAVMSIALPLCGVSDAFDYVKACIHEGVLCKETHDHTIRFAPPIPVSYEELDDALARITKALTK